MYVDRENGTIVYRANGFEYVIRPEVLTFSSVPLVRRQPNPAEDKIVVAMTNDREFRIRDGQNVLKIPDVIEVSKRDILPEEYKAVGAAYSVVVNRYGEDYAELGLTKWCSVCEREETEFVKDVKLKVLGDGACSFSDEVLIKDLEERVVGFRRKNGRKIF
jgi:hypothetical protein